MTSWPRTAPIETLGLAGDAYARGRDFGSVRSARIRVFVSDWLRSLQSAGIADPQAYVAAMLRETDFRTAIRKHAPDLLDEVRGIATGAGQPYELLLAAQFMDEEWAYRPSRHDRQETAQKCSSVAINSRTGYTMIGQNMDLGRYTDGHQLLLRIAPAGAEVGALVFTIGAMIGLLGVNARGVGVCVNSLPQLPSARDGLPVAFVVRKLLQAENLATAVAMVRDLPHATGQHYLLADSSSIRSFEASPVGVVEYRAQEPSRVLHTNHPLVAAIEAAEHSVNSVARLRSLTQRLMTGDPRLSAIKAALSSSDDPEHPVCRLATGDGDTGTTCFTTGSMISAIDRASPTISSWVSAGPPALRGYARVDLPLSR